MYNNKLKVYEGYIYLITNLINGKNYVGQTTRTIEERWKQHVNATIRKTTTLLDKKIKEYGKENFKVVGIAKYSSPDLEELKNILDKNERKYIQKFNSMVGQYGGNGYNVDLGGQMNNVFSHPVDVYDMDGNFIITYPSRVETSIKLNVAIRTINDICYGRLPNYKCICVFRNHGDPFEKYNIKSIYYKDIYIFTLDGYLIDKCFSVANTISRIGIKFNSSVIDNPHSIVGKYWLGSTLDFNYQGEKKKPTKAIDMYDLFGNKLKSFTSLAKASNETGYVVNAIRNNCEGKTAVLDKYLFRYKGDKYNKYDDIFKEEILNNIFIYNYPIIKYDSKTYKPIKKYDYIYQYIEETSTKKGALSIIECCQHNRLSAYGYIWRFDFDPLNIEKYKEEIYQNYEYNFEPLDIYDLDCKFIKTVYTRKETRDFLNRHKITSIYSIFSTGKSQTMYGYIWKKHGDKPPIKKMVKSVPVDLYNLDGKLIKSFNSIIDGAKFIGRNKQYCNNIKDCLDGRTLISLKQYVWRYKGHPFDEFPLEKRYRHVEVNCYDLNDSFIKTFYSIKSGAEFVNRSQDSLTQCCKGISKQSGGYKWFYANDPSQPDKTKIVN